MPTNDPRARYPKGNVRLSIPSLSGGVGRQAPTKRAVNEAENIDNALITLERSVEKRSPMEFIRRYTDPTFNVLSSDPLSQIDLGSTETTADLFFYWFSVSDTQRYLISIDYASTNANTYFNIYRTTSKGFYKCTFAGAASFHEYFTYGYSQGLPRALKAITIGPQLIILNSNVYAGYTSVLDSTATPPLWTKIGMDGEFMTNNPEDTLGKKLTYFTTTPVDPAGEATLYVNSKFYIKNDQVFGNVTAGTDISFWGYVLADHPELTSFMDPLNPNQVLADTVLIFNCTREGVADVENVSGVPAYDDGGSGQNHAHFALRSVADGGALAKFIPVEDWNYPQASKPYLGSALDDFSEFQFPPDESDITDTSEGNFTDGLNKPNEDGVSHAVLAALYPNELGEGQNGRATGDGGKGKIYNIENSYAGEPPGFYCIRNSEDKPYVLRVRTPFEYSVLDAPRFPKIVKISSFDATTAVENFTIDNFNMEHRTAGTLQTNPGPACFKDGTQAPINSMAFFRDRLFLSVGDNVFSSRTGDFSDFWVEDPSTVQETDPIDVRLSTNKYAPVTTMTPFQQYLFINTGSDIQFTLKGSENRITPLNSEVSPTAFYSTSSLVNPILLGSQIYFFAPRRTYIYFNDATVSVNQAIETSLNAPDYLPANFGHVTVVPGYDSVLMLDNDNRKMMYVYTNRYSGGNVAQNAFFRYIYRTDIEFMESFDNDIYFVTRQADGGGYRYNLGFQKFREEDHAVPLLDNFVRVGLSTDEGTVAYDTSTDTTTMIVPKYFNINPEYVYVVPQESDPGSGEVYPILPENVSIVNGEVTVTFPGDVTYTGRQYIIGTGYTMTVELSPQYLRDEKQNMIEGVVSLRTMSTQHFNSGSYRVEKDINGRRSTTMLFSPQELDALQHTSGFDVPLPLYESRGETFSKIMGFSADTKIFIVSDYASPVNITQIELKGRYTGKSSGFVR